MRVKRELNAKMGKFIKKRRSGIPLCKAAQLVNRSRQFLSSVEKELPNLNEITLFKLMRTYDINPEDFIGQFNADKSLFDDFSKQAEMAARNAYAKSIMKHISDIPLPEVHEVFDVCGIDYTSDEECRRLSAVINTAAEIMRYKAAVSFAEIMEEM